MADITPIPVPSPSTPADQFPDGLDRAIGALFGRPTDDTTTFDDKALLKRFEDAKKEALDLRPLFERQWWRNLLYVLGRQWIFFDTKRGEWRDKRLAKWVPRPVTNKIRDVVVAIRAVSTAITPGIVARPIGREPENIATANAADELQPVIHDENDMDTVLSDLDFWTIVCGNAFAHVWWDKDDDLHSMTVMQDVCVACGRPLDKADTTTAPVCPACGGTTFEPIPTQIVIGRQRTDVCSPFEILLPSYATTFEQVRTLIRIRWRPRRYYEEKFPELARKLTWEKAPTERSLHLFRALAAQNDLSVIPFSWGGAQPQASEGMTEYEYWEKPCPQYPKGLFFRVVGDSAPQILHDPEEGSPGPLPYTDRHGKPLWPWVHWSYEPFGGRLWAMGAVDPCIQKQDMINQLDSLILLIVQRMANPVWLEPKDANVEKLTGEPGLVVRYSAVGPTGAKPERIPGEGPHNSLFVLREQYIRDLEELAGTFDIIKGQKPPSVEAFSALQLLVERSQSRFTTWFKSRGRAYRQWYQIALEMQRTYGPTERVRAVLGPYHAWSFRHFDLASLTGAVDILVEDGSNVPKTSLGKRAAIEQANALRLIDPADPDQRYAILSDFGLQHLIPSLDSDVKSALEEQEAFERWVDQGLPGGLQAGMDILRRRPLIDNDQVHFQENRKWANTDRMRDLRRRYPEVEQIITLHLADHQLGMLTAAGQMPGVGGAPLSGAPPEPEPEPPGGVGGARAMANSNQESGATDTLPTGNRETAQRQGPI